MFVVTVNFEIQEGKASEFMGPMKQQAVNSLRLETGCHLFDVCVDANDEHRVFLYEIYATREAFDHHMNSEHFRKFNETVTPLVKDKQVSFWILEDIG